MKKMFFLLSLFICGGIAINTTACSSSAHIIITDKPFYTLTAEFLPGNILANTLKNFADRDQESQSLFDPTILKETFTASGITLTNTTLIGMSGLQFACTIPEKHPLFSQMIQHNREKKDVRIHITPELITNTLMLIPEDNTGFIEMLAAPIFTGENMTTQEYEATIAAIYGKKLAAELKKSVFTLEITCPYIIQKAAITPVGTLSGKRPKTRRIAIPLTDLLCTKAPITIELKGRDE